MGGGFAHFLCCVSRQHRDGHTPPESRAPVRQLVELKERHSNRRAIERGLRFLAFVAGGTSTRQDHMLRALLVNNDEGDAL